MTLLVPKQTVKNVILFLKCLDDDPAHELFPCEVVYTCGDMEITLCGLVTSAVLMERLTRMTTASPLEKLRFKDQWIIVLMISHKFCEEIPRHTLANWLMHLNNNKDHCCYMDKSELWSLEISTLQALDYKILPSHEEFCKVTDGLDFIELQTRIGKPLSKQHDRMSLSKQSYGERMDADDGKTYRVVECSRHVNPSRIFTEREWHEELRITMSPGWKHLFTSILNTNLMVFVRETNENTI